MATHILWSSFFASSPQPKLEVLIPQRPVAPGILKLLQLEGIQPFQHMPDHCLAQDGCENWGVRVDLCFTAWQNVEKAPWSCFELGSRFRLWIQDLQGKEKD